MPTPFAPPIILSHKARTELPTFVRASSTPPSLGLRARIVLRAADTDTPTTLHIGRALGCGNHTVRMGDSATSPWASQTCRRGPTPRASTPARFLSACTGHRGGQRAATRPG